MSIREHYDVICSGSSRAAVTVAAELAGAGQSVLLVEDEWIAEPRRGFDGSDFLLDPDLPYSDSSVQVCLPEYRIDIPKFNGELRSQLEQKCSNVSPEELDFLSQLQKAALDIPEFLNSDHPFYRESHSVQRRLERYWGDYAKSLRETVPVRPGPVAEILAGVFAGRTFVVPQSLSYEQIMRSIPLLMREPVEENSLSTNAKQDAYVRFEKSGGHVLRTGQVQGLLTEEGRVVGVMLSSFDGAVKGESVVLGSRWRRHYQTMPAQLQDTAVQRQLHRMIPHSWRFSIWLRVDPQVLPLGLMDNVIYYPQGYKDYRNGNVLLFQVIDKQKILKITSFVPYIASSMSYGFLRRLAGQMLQNASELMPYLESSILEIYPDFREDDLELRETYPFRGVDWVPENLIQYYSEGGPNVQDYWGLDWNTIHENLYFVGRAVWPSLGVAGELKSAKKAAAHILNPASRRTR